MSHHITEPRPREIAHSVQTIRAQWTPAKRRERKQLAKSKQRQLLRCLTIPGLCHQV